MLKRLVNIIFISCVCTIYCNAQISFTDGTSLLGNSTFGSKQPLGVSDLNNDCRDDIVKLDDGNRLEIEYQNPNGTFTNYTETIPYRPWGLAIADVDNNGYNDIVWGGKMNSYLKLLMNYGQSGNGSSLNINSNVFLQGINFIDIDDDGLVDLYLNHDVGTNESWRNTGGSSFVFDDTMMPHSSYDGNYASVWSDYDNDCDEDLYISKCKHGVTDPSDPRRINLLWEDQGGSYSDVAPALGLDDGAQTWSADFGDIDNDGDMDLFVLNHTDENRMYVQTAPGVFTDMTAATGLNFGAGMNWQSIFDDFDNDGFIDLLITGDTDQIFMNSGNGTFSSVNPFPGTLDIQNAAIGDLNHDGFLDIYASYGFWNNNSPASDRLLLNDTNSNNWVVFTLDGTESNRSAVGAKLILEGEWGVQVREVRAGESYGIQNTLNQHFGLGTAGSIDRLTIRWPSGTRQVIENPEINTFHKITEEETCTGITVTPN